jgi:methyl-accepting chemotaxis protein
MDEVTQQNAAMVQQTTAAASSLKTEAEQLAALVGRFRTGREDGTAPACTGAADRRRRWSTNAPACAPWSTARPPRSGRSSDLGPPGSGAAAIRDRRKP